MMSMVGFKFGDNHSSYLDLFIGKEFDLMNRRILVASSQEMADKIVSILEIYEEERD